MGQLFVGSKVRVDCLCNRKQDVSQAIHLDGLLTISYQSFAISNISKIGNELEAIHNLATSLATTLDTKGQDTTKATLQILLRVLMRRMRFQPRVRHPRHIRIALQPLRQLQRILCMALATKTECLEAEQQLMCTERVQGRAEIAQDLDAHANRKR